jgi:hypothetical protein
MHPGPSQQQVIEHFHLQFCRLFMAGPNRVAFAIKGGCNLRFFFESIRYSEDLDLDVTGCVSTYALKERVSKTLQSLPLTSALLSRGIEIERISTPKQTDTTQRWKLMLASEGHTASLNTKIEFSRRAQTDASVVETIAFSVARTHGILPFVAPHYCVPAAIRQKVSALVGRAATQARDIFDLATLFSQPDGDATALAPVRNMVREAIDCAASVSYSDYLAQVVSYLVPDQAPTYGTTDAWSAIQLQVITTLEEAL